MIAQTTLSILHVSLSWLDYTTSMYTAEKATGFFYYELVLGGEMNVLFMQDIQ